MTWTSLLICFLALSLASVAILVVILNYKTQTRWMRIFSEKQGIPAISMELKTPEREVVQPKVTKHKAFSIPIPGGNFFKTK